MLTFKWVLGDITKDKVDVIVNAANATILGGGGVDGAIHRAAGPKLLQACQQIRNTKKYKDGVQTGHIVSTYGYNLPADTVFHAVGPIFDDGGPEELDALRHCYIRSILHAIKGKFRSIAFPAISTGAYGFPKGLAALLVWEVMNAMKNDGDLEVRFYFMSEQDMIVHQAVWDRMEKKHNKSSP